MKKFPFYAQADQKDCGPTCLKMIARFYGRVITSQHLRQLSETTRQGSSLKFLADAAETIGFRTMGVQISYQQLSQEAPLPCIVHWQNNHFVIVYRVAKGKIYVADPAQSLITYHKKEFIAHWTGSGREEAEGVALLLEPTPRLNQDEDAEKEPRPGLGFIYRYLFRYKSFLYQLLIGLIAASLLELLFPFLTQSIVDIGIRQGDLNFIYLILVAQVFLFLGRTAIEIIRGWILLHLTTRINLSLISDFFIKLMQLPIAYFDSKMTGDILQRINDHERIEKLLTTTSLNVLFSLFSLIILGSVLAFYDWRIFGLFLTGSLLYLAWILLFMKRRKELDYRHFEKLSQEQSKVIELINGMQEIKLHNAEREKRWGWENLQVGLFKLSVKSLALEQSQGTGAAFINELKNILITVFAARLVIAGEITLGMLLAISYIVGQLNNPISRLVGFVYSLQDARIALERLGEIHRMKEESPPAISGPSPLPAVIDLSLDKVNFRYPGSLEPVIKDLSLHIPANKITAIVGASGSGKTTLIKLLLQFYPTQGIMAGSTPLQSIAPQSWREQCGTVMQEGYIFNDTIANNIAVGQEGIDTEKLRQAVETAHVKEFIECLPLGYNTQIGAEGMGISTGQKQRLLIARAVYKDPSIIFFDEATSALDASNERKVMEQLKAFLNGRTAVVVAHRLSTVRNADQIAVMDKGRIVEKGTHDELVVQRGYYYNLVKNQLELNATS